MKHVTFVLPLALFFIAIPVATVLGDDATTFTLIRLSVDDKGAGVLTVDSRSAGGVKQPEPSSSEPADLKFFGKATISTLKDGRLDVGYDFSKVGREVRPTRSEILTRCTPLLRTLSRGFTTI